MTAPESGADRPSPVRRLAPASGSEIKVAHIGLVGAVLAALVAALLGGLVAGYFALTNTTKQLTGETERSKAEFLRTQRQVLYAQVLADNQQFDVIVDAFKGRLEELTPAEAKVEWQESQYPSASADPESLSAVVLARDQLRQDAYAVDIIGSDSARVTAHRLARAQWQVAVTLINQAESRAIEGRTRPEVWRRYSDERSAAADAVRAFVEQARLDMVE